MRENTVVCSLKFLLHKISVMTFTENYRELCERLQFDEK